MQSKNILICTQVLDSKSSTLAFMVDWIIRLSPGLDNITVICLYKGEYKLPPNVTVYSLGKEIYSTEFIEKNSFFKKVVTRIRYLFKFYYLILTNINKYDKVFVHQIEEYVLLGGLFWKLFSKPNFMWRNHYTGSYATKIAGYLCGKVFYTSKSSYTAKFINSKQMPVGVNLESLETGSDIIKESKTILFLARLDPSKRPDIILRALKIIKDKNIYFKARFVGGTSKDKFPQFEKEIKELARSLGLDDQVEFVGAVPGTQTYKYYLSHSIYVNASKSGMLDKTIFKALAAGCATLTASDDYNEMIGNNMMEIEYDNVYSLVVKLEELLSLSQDELDKIVKLAQSKILKDHNLNTLAQKLISEFF
jgi:glycosyltransferase involved in cell wall biosynthesis